MNGKKIWKSKTFWVNLVSLVGIVYQSVSGDYVVGPEAQAAALTVINLVLRAVTGEPIVWEEGKQKIKRG